MKEFLQTLFWAAIVAGVFLFMFWLGGGPR